MEQLLDVDYQKIDIILSTVEHVGWGLLALHAGIETISMTRGLRYGEGTMWVIDTVVRNFNDRFRDR